MTTGFAICIDTTGADDLVLLRVYTTIPDEAAEAEGLLRVIDESGEDYLYPVGHFLPLALDPEATARLARVTAPRP
jgi:hypothetical protein